MKLGRPAWQAAPAHGYLGCHGLQRQHAICQLVSPPPFGRYGGALSGVRVDDLSAIPLRALMARNPQVDWAVLTDVLLGCANQAGEAKRNVARMSALLAGEVPNATINRLCCSSLDSVGHAAVPASISLWSGRRTPLRRLTRTLNDWHREGLMPATGLKPTPPGASAAY